MLLVLEAAVIIFTLVLVVYQIWKYFDATNRTIKNKSRNIAICAIVLGGIWSFSMWGMLESINTERHTLDDKILMYEEENFEIETACRKYLYDNGLIKVGESIENPVMVIALRPEFTESELIKQYYENKKIINNLEAEKVSMDAQMEFLIFYS